MTDDYDVYWKRRRHAVRFQNPGFMALETMREDQEMLNHVADNDPARCCY